MSWPSFVRTTFDVPWVEAWSRHFDELSIDYCERLGQAARDSGTQFINIQLDPFEADQVDMASTVESVRLADIEEVKRWMDMSRLAEMPREEAADRRLCLRSVPRDMMACLSGPGGLNPNRWADEHETWDTSRGGR